MRDPIRDEGVEAVLLNLHPKTVRIRNKLPACGRISHLSRPRPRGWTARRRSRPPQVRRILAQFE